MKYIDKYQFNTTWECRLAEEKIINKYGRMSIITWAERQEIQIMQRAIHRDEIIKILKEYNGRLSP